MLKQTVAAGCIAGVVAACTGAGLEAAGDTMRDAGTALAGAGAAISGGAGGPGGRGGHGGVAGAAGRVMAGVGGALAAAGRAVAAVGGAGGAAGAAGAVAQEPAGDGLPRPHWVLRDASGVPVVADITPAYGDTAPQFQVATPTCVHVSHYGQRRINLAYEIPTGHIATSPACGYGLQSTADWHTGGTYFLEADCSGPAYGPPSSAASARLVGGVAYYVGGAGTGTAYATSYVWQTGACMPVTGSKTLAPFIPVPDDVVNLLPGAPYVVELAY